MTDYSKDVERWKKSPKPKNMVKPGPGQESVWDYPRPPKLEKFQGNIRVIIADIEVANTSNGLKLMETASPPTYYIPMADIQMDYLVKNKSRTHCEWKGKASYFNFQDGEQNRSSLAWTYVNLKPQYALLKDHLAFYVSKADSCWVNEEQVQAQAGDFYGGWITSNIVGPFKGDPGTLSW